MNPIVVTILLLICASALLVHSQKPLTGSMVPNQDEVGFKITPANYLDNNEKHLLKRHFPEIDRSSIRNRTAIVCKNQNLNTPIALYLLKTHTRSPFVVGTNLCVEQAYRHRGIGQMMVKLSEQWAKRHSKDVVIVKIPPSCRPSQKLFMGNGYRAPHQSFYPSKHDDLTLIKNSDDHI